MKNIDLEFDTLYEVCNGDIEPYVPYNYWRQAQHMVSDNVCANLDGATLVHHIKRFFKAHKQYDHDYYKYPWRVWLRDNPAPTLTNLRSRIEYDMRYVSLANFSRDSIGSELVNRSGKIAKRIRKYMHDYEQIDLSNDLVARLGELATRLAIQPGSWHFDITRDFGWDDGDFGDGGSCFWSSNSGAKDVILDAGGWAVRLFEPTDTNRGRWYKGYTGIARCWAIPLDQDGTFVIFNAYDGNGVLRLETFANVLKAYLNKHESTKVSLSNYGSIGDLLYINSGSGIVLSPNGFHSYSVDLHLNAEGYGQTVCFRCDRFVDDEDVLYSAYLDEYLCENCYWEEHNVCNKCHNTFHNDEMQENDHYSAFCQECYDSLYTTCDDCQHEVDLEMVFHDLDGNVLCEECYYDKYDRFCKDCGEPLTDERYDYCNDCQTRPDVGQKELPL